MTPQERDLGLLLRLQARDESALAALYDAYGALVYGVALRITGTSADAEDLRAHAAGRLAGFKVPKEIERRDAPLPRTASGKLRRAVLR